MYSIIYWTNGEGPYVITEEENRKTKVFSTLKEADKFADGIEERDQQVDCRVISIDSVHE